MKRYIFGALLLFSLCSSAQYYEVTNHCSLLLKEHNSHFSISVKPSNYTRYHNNLYTTGSPQITERSL